ncbi:CHAD domain-containing protein [Vibrio rotiferianus]|uniref:CHAD domain-containing protein n=1 Tax=Vibrio rotiferianus TaxID=190895 RepID=UPI0003A8A8EA|nr:CHAD domain-containing protein [Vibrio rotiferianus]
MSVSQKPAFELILHTESDLKFTLPRFFSHEFSYARQLEQGVKAGENLEFNHQYRVTLRRIRSLSQLLKDVLPSFERHLLARNLRILMKQTNYLRDLDVFVAEKSSYLDKQLKYQRALTSIFDHIQHSREVEQKRVSDWLETDCYRKTCVIIENSLHRASVHESLETEMGTLEYANQKISLHAGKIYKLSRKLGTQSSDDDIHKLRIECKKLRYLLDFFTNLYPKKAHNQNIHQLKLMQNRLGDFNDSVTQIAFLSSLKSKYDLGKKGKQTIRSLIKQKKVLRSQQRASALDVLKQFRKRVESVDFLSVYKNK